jgi:hypothetical protein
MTSKRLGFQMGAIAAIALGALLTTEPARAASCLNDVDCPTPACGGQVCDYNMGMTCQPAGVAPKGSDGWCTTDSDCKCMGLGATCVYPYCTFTTPGQAPGGGTGAGGASAGTGGASAGTGGATSAGTGGATATAATGGKSGSGGATSTDGGTTVSVSSSSSSGGCSLAGGDAPALAASSVAFLLIVGLGVVRRRRRA